MDVTKKKKYAEQTHPVDTPSNYINLKPTPPATTVSRDDRKAVTDNYINLEFSESLCHYENAKNVLAKAAGLPNSHPVRSPYNNACDKCGHPQKRCADNGDDEKSDYMTMEPVNGRMKEVRRNLFPGYLPMCPATDGKQQDMLKDIMNKSLAEKSVSIPSLDEYRSSSAAATVDGSLSKNSCRSTADEPRRRRSSSAGSSRYDYGPAATQSETSDRTSSAESMISQIVKCPNSTAATTPSSMTSSVESTVTAAAAAVQPFTSTIADNQQISLVHIRRSSSVPCKNNRDSSSSNDSGVSTGSLRYRGADFAEFELPLTTAMSTMRHRRTMATPDCSGDAVMPVSCVHGSLPRRSKSTDRLKDLSFRFQKFAGPMKSSSAGAEVPVCLKKDKGQLSLPIKQLNIYVNFRFLIKRLTMYSLFF